MESVTQRWERLSRGPFARLARHSVDRIFSGSEGVEPGELDLSIATVLALLATPGAFVALFCMDHYGSLILYLRGQSVRFDPYSASLGDEYFFIVLAMVVAGAVAVWKWDRLVPDRRDYSNLAPLPVSSSRIFLANLAALSLLAVVLSLDVNAVSSFLFPLIVCAQQTSHVFGVFLLTHTVTIVVASAFGFLAVFALLGSLMALPYRIYRKASVYARCVIVFMLMALLTTSFSVPRKMQHLRRPSHAWEQLPPPAWFLGLCQTLRGQKSTALTSLSGAAIVGLFCVLLLSFVAYSFSYARCFAQSAETMANLPAGRAPLTSAVFRLLDAVLLGSSFQRACYRFAFRTIFRSEEQAFALGGFLSLGIVIAAQALLPAVNAKRSISMTSAVPPAAILSVPLIVGFFLILGLWSVCAIPAPLRANWVFRFHVNSRSRECAPLARKVILTFIVPALAAVCLPVYSHFWGWRVGVIHTALVAIWSVLLMEGLLVRFRKIPFTCSLPKFKSHAIVTGLLVALGYFAFTSVTATVERWALVGPLWFVLFTPLVLGVSVALYRRRKTMIESDRWILFEEQSVRVVEVLNLND